MDINIPTTYIRSIPREHRSPEEHEALALAKHDGDESHLRMSDVKTWLECAPQSTLCHLRARGHLQRLQQALTTAAVERHTATLTERWPDFDPSILITLTNTYAPNIGARDAVIERLVQSSTQHPTLHEGTAAMVYLFAITTLVLENLAEAHRQWVANGNPPITDVDIPTFVRQHLGYLRAGKLHLGVLDAPRAGVVGPQAAYDSLQNMLLFPHRLSHDPTHVRDNFYLTMFEVIPHELHHAERDAQQKKIPWAHDEINGHIFGTKCAMLVLGVSNVLGGYAKAVTTANTNVARSAKGIREQALPNGLRDLAEISLTMFHPTIIKRTAFVMRTAKIAAEELRGAPQTPRGDLQQRYASTHLRDWVRTQLVGAFAKARGYHDQYGASWKLQLAQSVKPPEHIDRQRTQHRRDLESTLAQSTAVHPEEVEKTLRAYMRSSCDYLLSLYVHRGSKAAQQYMESLKELPFHDTVIDAFHLIMPLSDGLEEFAP